MLQYDRFICRFDGVAVAEIQLAYPHRSPAIEERDRIAGIIFNAHLANIDRRDAVYTQRDGLDAGMKRMVGCRVGYPVCIEVEAVAAIIFIAHVRIVGGDLHTRTLYKTAVCYLRLFVHTTLGPC